MALLFAQCLQATPNIQAILREESNSHSGSHSLLNGRDPPTVSTCPKTLLCKSIGFPSRLLSASLNLMETHPFPCCMIRVLVSRNLLQSPRHRLAAIVNDQPQLKKIPPPPLIKMMATAVHLPSLLVLLYLYFSLFLPSLFSWHRIKPPSHTTLPSTTPIHWSPRDAPQLIAL